MTEKPQATRVRIWDGPVRLVHWSILALVAFAWWTGENDHIEWHLLAGYAALTLVLFRLYWGFVGSETARFAHFLRGPDAIFAYARKLFSPERTPSLGHNPMGGWSVFALLALLLGLLLLGLFAVDVDGIESGPLSALVTFDQGRLAADWHYLLFEALLVLIAIHLCAIAFYAVFKRDNLVGPMLTGAKKVTQPPEHEPKIAPLWRAMIGLLLSAAIVFAVSKAFWLR